MATRVLFFANLIRSLSVPPKIISKRSVYKLLSKTISTSAIETMSIQKPPGLLSIFEKSPKRLKRIRFLGELFEANGFELRIAGGAVRDILTNKEPHDIDFATDARPDQSLEILKKHEDILRIIVTTAGQRHGTVAVKFKEAEIDFKRIKLSSEISSQVNPTEKPEYDEESPFEITTLRCDVISDGRHAEVQFINDWRKDAERRDLTINAMFLTLKEGKLIDYFGGESDLRSNIVRFVGDPDLRMKEDYLRILRFFRFWSRYGRHNQPDEETITKMQANMSGLNGISGERIWQEVKKTLSYYPCKEVVELMLRLRVFNYAGLQDDRCDDYDKYCKQVLDEVSTVQEYVRSYQDRSGGQKTEDSKKIIDLLPVIIFSSLIHSEEACLIAHERMKFSNVERDTILYIALNRNKDVSKILAYKYQIAMLNNQERPAMMLKIRAFLIFKNRFDFFDELDSWTVPPFPITGKLVSAEVKKRKLPGTSIKTAIDYLRDYWASNDFTPTEEELASKLYTKLDEMKS